MKSSFWEEPLAEKVIFPTKKKRVPPKYLGFLVRLSFVVTAVLGGTFYYVQDITQQVLEASPVQSDCKVLGSLDGRQLLLPTAGDPLEFTLAGTTNVWVLDPANCQSLFTRAFAQPWLGSEYQSIRGFNLEARQVYSPELQEVFDCLSSGSCTKYVYADLEKTKGSTLTLFCSSRVEQLDISTQNCTTVLLFKVMDKKQPLGLDSINAEFVCDGLPKETLVNILPNSSCARSYVQTGFNASVANFCNNLASRVGPYLCKESSKRSPLDIVNLAFAAGSAAVIISTIVVSFLHRVLNGDSEEVAKPTTSGGTELT